VIQTDFLFKPRLGVEDNVVQFNSTKQVLSALVNGVDSSYTGGIRVGGYRINLGTGFAWLDGTPWNAFDSGNWNTGEPNNAGGIENTTELYAGNGRCLNISTVI
jgi:hypothetical protein